MKRTQLYRNFCFVQFTPSIRDNAVYFSHGSTFWIPWPLNTLGMTCKWRERWLRSSCCFYPQQKLPVTVPTTYDESEFIYIFLLAELIVAILLYFVNRESKRYFCNYFLQVFIRMCSAMLAGVKRHVYRSLHWSIETTEQQNCLGVDNSHVISERKQQKSYWLPCAVTGLRYNYLGNR